MSRTVWRGVVLDERSAQMMAEVARITPNDLYVQPTQGSYSSSVSASAGTHAGGGAIDLHARTLSPEQRQLLVRQMRRVGWAAWLRTPAQAPWPYHVHGIAVGCRDLSKGAKLQVNAYRNGRNGLASNGPDDGPRDFVGVTWESYSAGKTPEPEPSEEEVPSMRIIKSPGRGAALYAGGYFKPLNDEQHRILVGKGVPESSGNDREYDVIRATVLQGATAVEE